LPPASVAEDVPSAGRRRWLTPSRLFFSGAALITYLGWRLPTERYVTPESGLGYWLGIIGGSMMLLLFLYSLRKRVRWLASLGSLTKWFEVHMVLGIVGPILILYHSNFTLGATNSNVTLFCMLTVVGSGLIGRYLYSRVHFGLHGRKVNLADLQAGAARLRAANSGITFLPELADRLDVQEARVLGSGPRLPVLSLMKPLVVWIRAIGARWQLHRYVRRALRAAARRSVTLGLHRKRLRRAAFAYVDQRLRATRRVAAFETYERLFSLWYVLHVPMLVALVIAASVHVIAVHVY
jgi:hypothetical protein